MANQIHPTQIRQVLFLMVLALLLWVIGQQMYFLLGAFLGAVTFYVLLRNYMYYLVKRLAWRKSVAAFVLIFASIVAIVGPTIWLVSLTITKITPFLAQPHLLNQSLEIIHVYFMSHFQIDIVNPNTISKINAQMIPILQQALGSTLSSIGNLLMMYFILYFLLTQSDEVENWLLQQIPLKKENTKEVIRACRNMVYSNAVGIPIVAMIQGVTGLIGYWIFGVYDFVLLGVLTAVCSIIPIVGAMVVYIPIAMYKLATGYTWEGIAILSWGFLLIGSVDNIARFLIQKRIANVHPLITIFGVIIGINMFGVLGIIYGPLLISVFVLLVKMYIDEFGVGKQVAEKMD
jgi:predicted PurR-regulated permease PerM